MCQPTGGLEQPRESMCTTSVAPFALLAFLQLIVFMMGEFANLDGKTLQWMEMHTNVDVLLPIFLILWFMLTLNLLTSCYSSF